MTTVTLSAEWWQAAACQSAEPELFFPISETAPARADVARAKLICAACPVASQCLDYALANRQEYGIWGGLTEQERRRVIRHRIPSGTAGHALRR
jgi:WhiB family transcriptional regulator, redox-sensing transcriptional regulator